MGAVAQYIHEFVRGGEIAQLPAQQELLLIVTGN